MSTPIRILVAEDEAIVAIDIQGHLEALGYEVVEIVATAAAAVSEAVRHRPDLVLMDIQLGGGSDGVRAAEEIRRTLGTPVIFLTAFADDETLGRATAVSPHGYIVKPFQEEDLATTIGVALSRLDSEAALKRSHDDILAILDSQRQGSVAVGPSGIIGFLSLQAQRMLGRTAGETVGKPWSSALPFPQQVARELDRLTRIPASSRPKVTAVLPAGDRLRNVEIEMADDPRAGGRFILFLYDVTEVSELRRILDEGATFQKIIGTSKAMRAVFQLIADVADVDTPVLIDGETGTGKELVAKAIHRLSGRESRPFIPVNCGGLNVNLAASQFFGHRKGAFTGALRDHRGFFDAAQGGTLFLDEVGDLPSSIQPALLRILEDRKISRLGDSGVRSVDFRLIAATGRDLAAEIERGSFRPDLYYRLSVARISLPPLRERREDLPTLLRSFLQEACAKTGKAIDSIDGDAMDVLLRHPWPGNVRQLKNAIEFATIRSRRRQIGLADLPLELLTVEPSLPAPGDDPQSIREALVRASGNRSQAARILGISRSTLYRRLRDLQIEI